MPVFMRYEGVDGQLNDADAYDFSQLMSEPTAPAGEVNHSEFAIVKRLNSTAPTVDYVFGVEVPKLTSEPTAPEAGGGPKDWIIVESYQFADNAGADGKGYLLTSIQHSATDTTLVDQSGTEASSRLFVGNLTLNSEPAVPAQGDEALIDFVNGADGGGGFDDHDAADFVAWQRGDAIGDPITFTVTISNPSSATAFPGFAGGVRVASGDVNGGDNEPDRLVGVSGSDWTFDFQPQLTSEPTAPQAGGGHNDWIILESCQFADNAGADGKATEESQFGDPPGTPITYTVTIHPEPDAHDDFWF